MIELRTSESVTQGHPDKVCDQIADAILDAALTVDSSARVAIEVLATKGHIVVAGELSCQQPLAIEDIVIEVLKDIGYDAELYHVTTLLNQQSADIAAGVEQSPFLGAGDQGTVYGYASDESPSYLPLSLHYSHEIVKRLDQCRHKKIISGLKPDGKAQVSLIFEDGQFKAIKTIVISIQHDENKDYQQLEKEITTHILKPIFNDLLTAEVEVLINPSGRFVIGGMDGDTGVTGRKLMVDTYGGQCVHGGGAFSGKDATKVDRSAAYMARLIAKQVVADKLAKKCRIAISYAIGKSEPVALAINTFDTAIISDQQLLQIIQTHYDLRPKAIIDYLQLQRPIYRPTSTYGHFGNENYRWEQVTLHKLALLLK